MAKHCKALKPAFTCSLCTEAALNGNVQCAVLAARAAPLPLENLGIPVLSRPPTADRSVLRIQDQKSSAELHVGGGGGGEPGGRAGHGPRGAAGQEGRQEGQDTGG